MVKLLENKFYTENKAIEKLPLPNKVYIPLSQHTGAACDMLDVKSGDIVLRGQRLAYAQAKVFSPIHASISGKVTAVQNWPHPALDRCRSVVIESDGGDKAKEIGPRSKDEIQRLKREDILRITQEAGIVGLGGAAFPTHIKLDPPQAVDTLIVNCAECEPYLTADYRIMVEKTEEVMAGISLAALCLNVKNVIIAIENNKPEAIEKFSQLHSGGLSVKVRVFETDYPQGGEKQLIKNVLGREVPQGKLPSNAGVIVQNVATLFALYEAVHKNKSLYERVVTVTGSIIANPKNLLVRIGTPISNLIEYCGIREEPAKIIIGGPMMGVAQHTDMVPVIKSTTGIILLNKKEAESLDELPCIRCGACVYHCPQGLLPCLINLAAIKELWEEAKLYGALDCTECGSCSYVCPAKRYLVQSIKRAKLEMVR